MNFRYHRNETIDYTSPRGGISVVNSENNSPEITSTLLIYQASIQDNLGMFFLITRLTIPWEFLYKVSFTNLFYIKTVCAYKTDIFTDIIIFFFMMA